MMMSHGEILALYLMQSQRGVSERCFCEKFGIPNSTIRRWRETVVELQRDKLGNITNLTNFLRQPHEIRRGRWLHSLEKPKPTYPGVSKSVVKRWREKHRLLKKLEQQQRQIKKTLRDLHAAAKVSPGYF